MSTATLPKSAPSDKLVKDLLQAFDAFDVKSAPGQDHQPVLDVLRAHPHCTA